MARQSKGLLFVVSGPSGSGKTTLAQAVRKAPGLRKNVSRSVSFTTRPKRCKEKEGRDYFFVSTAQFKKLRSQQKILEWTRYLGYYYGTPKQELDRQLAAGRNMILCLDVRGARKVKRLYPRDSVTIFVVPPSLEVLKERIQKRCSKTGAQEIAGRLKAAQEELKAASGYEYRIVNEELSRSVHELSGIIKHRIDKRRKGK